MGTTGNELAPVSAEDLGASAGAKGDNFLMAGRAVAALPPEIGAKVEVERMLGQITAALASMTWGQRMTPLMRRATAQYCLAYGIDPLTELDLLGGVPYVNSEFYLRKLGELRIRGIVVDYWLDNLANDEQLLRAASGTGNGAMPEAMREWATTEYWRRWQRRRELGAKEEAEAVCACHIVLAGGGHPIVGWKQGGGGTSIKQFKSGGGAAPNPVVEEENNSALAVESQAVRRAVRQIKSHVESPGLMELARYFEGVEEGAKALGAQIRASKPPQGTARPFSGQDVSPAGASYGYEDKGGLPTGDRARKALPEGAPAIVATDPYTEEPVAMTPPPSPPNKDKKARWAGPPTNIGIFSE
jgi:hypothetical protein